MDSKELKGLMEAYSEVYAPQEIDEANSLAAMQARREKRLAAQRKREGTTAAGKDFGHNYWQTAAQRKADQDAEYKAGMKKEEVDIFDVILEHLVAEGYADTNEAALAIMANMSEEWRDSIVEGIGTKLAAAGLAGIMGAGMMNAQNSVIAKRQYPGGPLERDKTELVSKADKEKKDAEERRQAELYAQGRVDQARRAGIIK